LCSFLRCKANFSRNKSIPPDVEIKEAQLEKEYFERFKKILSPEKVYKYRNAEYKFVRNFMKSGRDNKKEEKQKK